MVATVVELRSSAVAVSYYERDGYYAKNDPEHRQASFWHGAAAKALGLRAHVRPKRFESVLSGHVPGTDIRLGRMREGEHEHRPGWDITFSAPKSVSLEALVMGDRRVIRAHDEAVRATLDWVETELLETRGWDPAARRRPRVKAHGMVVAGFRHLASRDLDPQLHTHCVLANMTRNAAGEWRSVEPTRIRRSAKLVGAYYRNELARRLQAHGMAVTPTLVGRIPGFELAGYARSFLEAFSGRRREILAHLERLGLPYTAQLAQMAALHTRRRKRDESLAELVPKWRARARALGLVREKTALSPPRPADPLTGERARAPAVPLPDLPANELRSLKRAPALPRLPRDETVADPNARPMRPVAPAALSAEPERGVLEAVARAVAHTAERRTFIPESEIRAVALGHAPGRYTLAEVDAAIARLVRGGELVETERRGLDRAFVTDRAVRTERRLLASMRSGRGKSAALAHEDAVGARLRETGLTRGQQEAVRTVLLSHDLVVGVQGHAGSGKTTMLREVAGLLGARRIAGLAPSSSAARVLAREAGIPSRTLQWFLIRHGDLSDPKRLARARAEYGGAVLAVDEASMIDTARMEALLRIARGLGVARVALVGDTAQLRAVDAGQPFRLLQKAGMATAVMDEVLRQRDPELLAAVMRSRTGEPGAAITGLGKRVREVGREELGAQAGRCWLALPPEERAGTAVMAPTHAIRRQANEAVREGLAREGVLHGRVLEIDRLVDRRLTRAQASDIRSWEPGDIVVFHRDVFGCHANDVCMVTGTEEGHVVLAGPDGGERRFRPSGNAAGYMGLYDTERIEVMAGDRIRWTRNRKAPRPRFGHPPQPELVSGGEAEIVGIDHKRVRFKDERGRAFSLARTDPQLRHLDHAYCTTVHAAQGRTARSAIAVLDAHGAVDRALFHVEVSRASEAFLLLTDDRDALIELLESRPDREDGALEALGLDPAEPPVVDPELFAALAADWRALRARGEEEGTAPFFLAGYREVMARAAALSAIEDLPADMRRFTDTLLAEHEEHLGRDREVRDLAARVRAHWRRWPELGWAATAQGCTPEDMAEHATWRAEGEALLDVCRERLGDDGATVRTKAGPEAGLGDAVAALDRTRLMDDAGRFERGWRALRERAARVGVPELHLDGYAELAALGGSLAEADGLDARRQHPVAEWRQAHDAQAALAGAVCTLPGRAAAWRERRAEDLPLDEDGCADPDDPACRAWRLKGEALRGEAGAMLAVGSPHGPHLDALPGAREGIGQTAAEVGRALRDDRMQGLTWLLRRVSRQAREAGSVAFHAPGFGALIAQATAISGDAGMPEPVQEVAAGWLEYHARSERLCGEVRDWPGRADALLAGAPGPDAAFGSLVGWRLRAEALLAEADAIEDREGMHGAHLAAMPEERRALREAVGQLGDATVAVEAAEMDRLSVNARHLAKRDGGIAFDARGYPELMARVRSLAARAGLPEDLRGRVRGHLAAHRRWTWDRKQVAAFLERAGAVQADHDSLPPGPHEWWEPPEQLFGRDNWRRKAEAVLDEARALREDIPGEELAAHLVAAGAGPGAVGEHERKIADRIEGDDAAVAAAEAERQRQAEEQAQVEAEHARMAEAERLRREAERKRGRGRSM